MRMRKWGQEDRRVHKLLKHACLKASDSLVASPASYAEDSIATRCAPTTPLLPTETLDCASATIATRSSSTAPLRHCATAPLRHCTTAPLRHWDCARETALLRRLPGCASPRLRCATATRLRLLRLRCCTALRLRLLLLRAATALLRLRCCDCAAATVLLQRAAALRCFCDSSCAAATTTLCATFCATFCDCATVAAVLPLCFCYASATAALLRVRCVLQLHSAPRSATLLLQFCHCASTTDCACCVCGAERGAPRCLLPRLRDCGCAAPSRLRGSRDDCAAAGMTALQSG